VKPFTKLRLFWSLSLVVVAAGFSGCESMQDVSEAMRERFAVRNAGRSRVYQAEVRTVWAAARASVEALGFRFTRGGPATGVIEAVSALASDNNLRGSRQVSLKAQVSASGAGSQLNVRFTEIIEDNFNRGAGQATETPLKDTPLYEVFFREVEKTVGAEVK
jgi:hypothetical protein